MLILRCQVTRSIHKYNNKLGQKNRITIILVNDFCDTFPFLRVFASHTQQMMETIFSSQ